MASTLPPSFRRSAHFIMVALFAVSAVLACGDEGAEANGDAPIFSSGCPELGKALARRLGEGEFSEGPDAVGREGDWLLANEKAAFVVMDIGRSNVHYYYGGILVDAYSIEGCRQATLDQFNELGLIMGNANLAKFHRSVLRASNVGRSARTALEAS